MSALVLALVRIGFLVLLWLFILAVARVIRADLTGPRQPRPAARQPAKTPAAPRRKRKTVTPRQLVVTAGALKGTTLSLSDAPVTIGRAPDNTLVLNDEYASARHARLMPAGEHWTVEDLGSTNGTYLDRQKVNRPIPIPLGVPIRIGRTSFELRR